MGHPITQSNNLKKKVETCVTKLYKTDSHMSDSDFTTHETDEFAVDDVCEDSVGCITHPLESNDFVGLKLATKKTVKYFVGLIEEMEPSVYNTRFLNKRPTCWIFCLPNNEHTAVIDLTNTVLKLPHSLVSVSKRRIFTYDFWHELDRL